MRKKVIENCLRERKQCAWSVERERKRKKKGGGGGAHRDEERAAGLKWYV